METVKPKELLVAARVADGLVYAAGLAGVIAGGLLFRQEDYGFAVVAWALTFVAGAALRLAAWGARALAELLVRTSRMEDDLSRLVALRRPPTEPGPRRPPPDPGPWHS